MHLIAITNLRKEAGAYSDVKKQIESWYAVVKKANWPNLEQVKQTYKDTEAVGNFTVFNLKGNKVAIGYYKKGKKVGTWFQWKGNTLRQINYDNNTIASVSTWREDTKVAVNR